MNFYNPYMSVGPMISTPVRTNIFSRILGGNGINFSSILNGAQKTIGFANQALPLIKQVGPVVKNAKTMFQIMNEFRKVDSPTSETSNKEEIVQENKNNTVNNGPTFFI